MKTIYDLTEVQVKIMKHLYQQHLLIQRKEPTALLPVEVTAIYVEKTVLSGHIRNYAIELVELGLIERKEEHVEAGTRMSRKTHVVFLLTKKGVEWAEELKKNNWSMALVKHSAETTKAIIKILEFLKESKTERNTREISAATGISSGVLIPLIRQLKEDGFVQAEKTAINKDSCKWRIIITKKGLDFLEKHCEEKGNSLEKNCEKEKNCKFTKKKIVITVLSHLHQCLPLIAYKNGYVFYPKELKVPEICRALKHAHTDWGVRSTVKRLAENGFVNYVYGKTNNKGWKKKDELFIVITKAGIKLLKEEQAKKIKK